jgi:hypothetical protein
VCLMASSKFGAEVCLMVCSTCGAEVMKTIVKHAVNFAGSQKSWFYISSKEIWSLNFRTVRLLLHERNIYIYT